MLGAISAVSEANYPGIAIQAVGLHRRPGGDAFLYGTGIVRATEKFKIGVVAATGAICLVYLADIVLSLFRIRISRLSTNRAWWASASRWWSWSSRH